jgi:signal transduction histidine kinase
VKLSIRTKLMAVLISSVVAMAIVGLQGVVGMREMDSMLNHVYANDFVPARLATDAESALTAWSRDTLNCRDTGNGVERKEYCEKALRQSKIVIESVQRLSKLHDLTGQEKDLILKIENNMGTAWGLWDRMAQGTDGAAGSLKDENGRLGLVVDGMTADLAQFVRFQDRQIFEAKERANSHYRHILLGIFILSCLVLFAAALINFLVSRTIARSLSELSRGAEEFGKGNLEYHVDVSGRDELGRLASAFNRMASERKHVENALRGSERRLRSLSSRLVNAHEEERKRIAVELHDSIGSSLSAVKFSLEHSMKLVEGTPECFDALKTLVSLTQTAMDEVRRIMTDLRPSMLDDLGLLTTIGWFCKQYRKIYPAIRVEEQIEISEGDIVDSLKIVIFRIIQEAFNNIAKYSGAEVARLALKRSGDTIGLTIEDNGIGFDLDSALSRRDGKKGLGLVGMRERAELAGGVLSVSSEIGAGTSIHASWPVQEESTGNAAPDSSPSLSQTS